MLEVPIMAKVMPLVLAGWMATSGMMLSFNDWIGGPWQKGHIGNEYAWSGKIYEEPSKFGINNGKISKLTVNKNGKVVVNYDRGWDIKPKNKQDKEAVNEILYEHNDELIADWDKEFKRKE